MALANPAALDRAIANSGSNAQMAPLFAKLNAGRPIVLGVVGASVAQNAGCLDQPRRRCMHFNGLPSPKHRALSKASPSAFSTTSTRPGRIRIIASIIAPSTRHLSQASSRAS